MVIIITENYNKYIFCVEIIWPVPHFPFNYDKIMHSVTIT